MAVGGGKRRIVRLLALLVTLTWVIASCSNNDADSNAVGVDAFTEANDSGSLPEAETTQPSVPAAIVVADENGTSDAITEMEVVAAPSASSAGIEPENASTSEPTTAEATNPSTTTTSPSETETTATPTTAAATSVAVASSEATPISTTTEKETTTTPPTTKPTVTAAPTTTEAATANASFADSEVVVVSSGSTSTFADQVAGSQPVIVWYWLPG